MKKLFYILFAISIFPANAATKCVAFNYEGSAQTASAERSKYDWSVTEKNGLVLYGISVCSATSGENETADTLSISRGDYCWCRVLSPKLLPWMFIYDAPADQCGWLCNVMCAEYAQNRHGFRERIFDQLSN